MKNKKVIQMITMLLLILLLFGLGSCGEKEKPTESSFSIQGQVTTESTGHLELNISIPNLSGFEAAETINQQIGESVRAGRTEVEEAAAMLEIENSEMKAGMSARYLYSKSGDLVSLWLLMDNYTGGAHGLYWIEPYTFDIGTNEIYTFSGLFQEGKDDIPVVTDLIVEKINENPDLYFQDAVKTVMDYQGEFSFYINGNQLVVFFSLYDIAPYAAGISYFDFDAEDLKDILKPEIYDAMKDATPVNTEGTIIDH